MQYSGVEIAKVDILSVPKKVRISVEEGGSEVMVRTRLQWWSNGTPLPFAVKHRSRTLVVSLVDMRADEEGTILFRVPRGYKKKTHIKKR